MRIVVMGAGGVGGNFGARLQAAGQDVAFVARGAHLQALRERGLRLESPTGNITLPRVTATDRPETLGAADVVLFAVKLWETEQAARSILPLVGPGTMVATFQNGVDSIERLSSILGPDVVLGGTTFIASVIAEPGVIRQTGPIARLVFGEVDGRISERAKALEDICRAAGIDVEASPRVVPAIWEKFIFLAALSGLTTLTRLTLGRIRAVPETRRLFIDAMAEVAAVARAKGIAVAPDIIEQHTGLFERLPHEMRSSMSQDQERGGRLELEWLSGAVVRLGAAAGVATPIHDVITRALLPFAAGRSS